MKKTILISLLFAGMSLLGKSDDLWKEYDAALKADKPRTRIGILDRIIVEAAAGRDSWSFYDAWVKKVSTGSGINWKDHGRLTASRDSAFAAYGEPVIDLVCGKMDMEAVLNSADVLKKKVNRGFYEKGNFWGTRGSSIYGNALGRLVNNDYEFALWYLLGKSEGQDAARLRGLIIRTAGAQSQQAAYAEYDEVSRQADSLFSIGARSALYERYGKRWEGSAASLLSGQMLLSLKMDTLGIDKAATSESFRKLRAECAAFELKRASFTGTGKLLAQECGTAANLIERLDGKEVRVVADSASVKVVFRNLEEAQLEILKNGRTSDEMIYSDTVKNVSGNYYILDTVAVPFPVKDDGEYVAKVKSGNIGDVCNIIRHSISLAAVKDAEGYKLYAARYDSGRPLTTYDLTLYRNRMDNPLASCRGIRQGIGFVLLPEEMSAYLKDGEESKYYVICSYTDSTGVCHASGQISFTGPRAIVGPPAGSNSRRAVLLTDCGAYHRGDVVHCKGIVYVGGREGEAAVAPKNTQVKLSLLDPDDNVIVSKQLKTNDFGSVVADFTLPSDIKGGLCTISLESDGRPVGSTTFRVDDFVLPDFECEFDSIDSLYFAGDSVTVSGRVKSYTGHRVPVASAYYELSHQQGRIGLAIDPDGSFSMRVPTSATGYWGSTLTLVVNTVTGSTLQFTRHIPASRWLDVRVKLENETPASVEKDGGYHSLLCEDKAIFKLEAFNSDSVPQRLEVFYTVRRGGTLIAEGSAYTGEKLELDMDVDGEYTLKFNASAKDSCGKTLDSNTEYSVIKLSPDSESLQADVENIFIQRPEEGIAFDMAASRGPVWAVVSLYGKDAECLYESPLHLQGELAKSGSIIHLALPYEERYPDSVTLRVFYFRNGRIYQWEREYERPADEEQFLLAWSRFEDKAVPGTEYGFTLKAEALSEVAVSVFDKSTETIHPNAWSQIFLYDARSASPYLGRVTGTMSGSGMMLTRSLSMDNGAATFQKAEAEEAVETRSDFSTTLCWQPQLKVPQKGEVDVKFRTSDKTGTFILSAFAHDRAVNSAVARREMVVSLPVELAVSEPVLLHEGDSYVLKAAVMALDIDVSGTLALEVGGIGNFSNEMEIGMNSSTAAYFTLNVPYGVKELPLKLTFTDKGKRFSDAVAFTVPVASSIQTLTESHSALLTDGSDRDATLERLRAAFVNTGSDGAVIKEISIPEMLVESLAPHRTVSEKSVLGLSDAIATNLLYNHLTGGNEDVSAMVGQLADFINPDGGFAWIGGMTSSPLVTSTILERNARVQARTGKAFLDGDTVCAAVRYLDSHLFKRRGAQHKVFNWSPDISLETYLFVRSFYPSVPFVTGDEDALKTAAEFGAAVDAYLFPKDLRSLPGRIFAKVLRLATLENIYALSDGERLLEGWHVGNRPATDVLKSMQEDIESLVEYSVVHRDGGIYFPNLVMPYRGLLSNEAYCHSLLCDLLAPYDAATADGIRLWLMLQKETQAWENDFSFTNAAASVMAGSDRLKNTSVMVMSKDYTRPYREIQAAGNGFRISRHFVLTSEDGKQSVLKPGATVNAGDKVTAVYRVWNAENRSFVRLSLPTYACLRPVQQLSGALHWGVRPLVGGPSGLAPQGYREVRYDRIDYYFDTFPEEDVEIRDEFFVTQTGAFTAPVVTVESLYAPHYRANGPFEGGLNAR